MERTLTQYDLALIESALFLYEKTPSPSESRTAEEQAKELRLFFEGLKMASVHYQLWQPQDAVDYVQ